MTSASPVRAVCFDLWNTLAWTDHRPHPLRAIAAAYGLESRPDWRRLLEEAMMRRPMSGIGEALDALERAVGAPPAGAPSRRELSLLWGSASNANRLFPDVIPALDRLSRPDPGRAWPGRIRTAILSNTQSFDLDFLRREGLDSRIDAAILSCHEGILKPDSRLFARVAGSLGLRPAEILMVGDSLKDDVLGATGAGMRAALLDRGGEAPGRLDDPEPVPPGVSVLHRLESLHEILRAGARGITP